MKFINALVVLSTISFAFGASSTTDVRGTLTGQVNIDGSSTVFPISEAVSEEFQKANKNVRVAAAVSGTGGGFKKLCAGEMDVVGASRPIEKSEIEACKSKKINFVELPVAFDGIAIVANKTNTWAKNLTTEELKAIWNVGSTIKNWKDVRKEFPDHKLSLYGPGHDSGTFDYFTKVINGKEKASRADFTASEDDNMLVKGVSGDKGGLGYFGYAYYVNNKDRLSLVSVNSTMASVDTIASGKYAPLSRPIFIYVNEASLQRPEVKAYAHYYVQNAGTLAPQVGYVSLGAKIYGLVAKRLTSGVVGSIYGTPAADSLGLEKLLTASAK